jgi:hypothetical protein
MTKNLMKTVCVFSIIFPTYEKNLTPKLELGHYLAFYHSYCKDQRKAVLIILQQTHGYWKIDAHHYIQRE